jgi:hypothetical protein
MFLYTEFSTAISNCRIYFASIVVNNNKSWNRRRRAIVEDKLCDLYNKLTTIVNYLVAKYPSKSSKVKTLLQQVAHIAKHIDVIRMVIRNLTGETSRTINCLTFPSFLFDSLRNITYDATVKPEFRHTVVLSLRIISLVFDEIELLVTNMQNTEIIYEKENSNTLSITRQDLLTIKDEHSNFWNATHLSCLYSSMCELQRLYAAESGCHYVHSPLIFSYELQKEIDELLVTSISTVNDKIEIDRSLVKKINKIIQFNIEVLEQIMNYEILED